MSKKLYLDVETRSTIVTKAELGIPQAQICKEFSIDRRTISRLLKKKQLTGSVKDLKKSGRHKKSTNKEDKVLYHMYRNNPKVSSAQLNEMWKEKRISPTSPVSSRTVRRRLNGFGLRGCIGSRKPLISNRNEKKRLHWALEHADWSDELWSRILWSDESSFMLVPSRRQTCWRKKGERYKKEHIVSTFKHGGGSIMVWGCMTVNGVGIIHRIEGTLDKEKYVDIMKNTVIPSGRALAGHDFVFQQDGATVHTAQVSMAWLKENDVQVLSWPPQSPDLNPIEHLWQFIKLKLSDFKPRNKDLWLRIKDIMVFN